MRKMNWNWRKCIANLMTLAGVMMIAWFMVGYAEIVIRTWTPSTTPPNYWNWNFFQVWFVR